MAKKHCTEHLILRQLLRLGFHHQYRVGGAGHDHIQLALGQLVIGGVEDIALRLVETHPGAGDRAVERAAGDRQRGGSADHGGDIRIHLLVRRHDRTDHLNLVHEPVGKERADGAINQARSERFFLAGPALALEKSAGDPAHRVGFFDVVHREGEKLPPGALEFFGHDRAQHRRVFHRDHDRARRLSGDAACFQGDRLATVLK